MKSSYWVIQFLNLSFSYSFDSQHKASVGEENQEDGNEEVDDEHVDDV